MIMRLNIFLIVTLLTHSNFARADVCPQDLPASIKELESPLSCKLIPNVRFQDQPGKIIQIEYGRQDYGDSCCGPKGAVIYFADASGKYEPRADLKELVFNDTLYHAFRDAIGLGGFWRDNVVLPTGLIPITLFSNEQKPCLAWEVPFPYQGRITHCSGEKPLIEVEPISGVIALSEAIEIAREALRKESPSSEIADSRPFPPEGRPNSHSLFYPAKGNKSAYWAMTYRAYENGDEPEYLVRVFSNMSVEVEKHSLTTSWNFESVK